MSCAKLITWHTLCLDHFMNPFISVCLPRLDFIFEELFCLLNTNRGASLEYHLIEILEPKAFHKRLNPSFLTLMP